MLAYNSFILICCLKSQNDEASPPFQKKTKQNQFCFEEEKHAAIIVCMEFINIKANLVLENESSDVFNPVKNLVACFFLK